MVNGITFACAEVHHSELHRRALTERSRRLARKQRHEGLRCRLATAVSPIKEKTSNTLRCAALRDEELDWCCRESVGVNYYGTFVRFNGEHQVGVVLSRFQRGLAHGLRQPM